MFVSHRYRLIYLEVPRTGSHSVTQALTQLDPDSPTARQRQAGNPAHSYHVFRLPDDLRDYNVLATHRNPYGRLWSFWKHRNQTGNPPVFKTVSWHEYVRWVCDPETAPRIKGAVKDRPVTELLDPSRVTHWLAFDRLEEDWDQICRKLRLPRHPLPRVNQSRDEGEFRSAYDDWLALCVYRRFQTDFSRFGYSENSWRQSTRHSAPDAVTTRPETNARPRVAILTNFKQSDPAYSLNRVVQDQIAMLVEHGYPVRVIVATSPVWEQPPDNYGLPGVEIVQLPQMPAGPKAKPNDTDQGRLSEVLQQALQSMDVVLAHDIIYQPPARHINAAAHQIARVQPGQRWLHWVHSATGVKELFDKAELDLGPENYVASWPNASLVCFNAMSSGLLAKNYECDPEDICVVPHPIDVCRFFGLSDLAAGLYRRYRLDQADYVSTFPVRLDRGKQVEWVIKILSRLKAGGDSVRLFVMDFHSRASEKSEYRLELKSIAEQWDIRQDELVFLSEFSQKTKRQSPHHLVRELFLLSNLFILPSRSESYSLSAQEAAAAGNLLVLNDDFPPMRAIYGEHALYFKFSSNIDRTSLLEGTTQSAYEDIEVAVRPAGFLDNQLYRRDGRWYLKGDVAYAEHIAARIRLEFLRNKTLAQRQNRLRNSNLFAVFKRYLEPLLYR